MSRSSLRAEELVDQILEEDDVLFLECDENPKSDELVEVESSKLPKEFILLLLLMLTLLLVKSVPLMLMPLLPILSLILR